ncbi:hypothetical protein SDC9_125349 [bioreactor metagenome]|uniref:Uncharacterized protein n=1 Tax=bioreactor metagenome TaxID=1076179 RepID=A0A645CN54_9ZZZZ
MGNLGIDAQRDGFDRRAGHPAKTVVTVHERTAVFQIEREDRPYGIDCCDAVRAVLHAPGGGFGGVCPVSAELADHGYVYMRLGIVQHGQKGILGVAHKLDHLCACSLHIRNDRLGFSKRVPDAADYDRARAHRLGNLFFIPEQAVAIRPFFRVDQRGLADLADMAHRVDGAGNPDGLCDHRANAEFVRTNHALAAIGRRAGREDKRTLQRDAAEGRVQRDGGDWIVTHKSSCSARRTAASAIASITC